MKHPKFVPIMENASLQIIAVALLVGHMNLVNILSVSGLQQTKLELLVQAKENALARMSAFVLKVLRMKIVNILFALAVLRMKLQAYAQEKGIV